MWQSIPELGSALLVAILLAASYTFAVALGSTSKRPGLLSAARNGAYGTVALVGTAILVLAYGFLSHDFRISYVARYSDRSMGLGYLITALWGGQDGSILWWLFLLSVYTAACVRWLKGRYLELQPYIIATLMGVILFFTGLMLFTANPFATSVAQGAVDGTGLNPALQNFYMIIHPPALYTGFVGCAVPFAFAIAALVTGRLENEWLLAVRKWMLFGWLFLSLGNALGMLWAYVELGWGGFWGWDPVENAALLPWLTATAFVHSAMIQERRNIAKVWNLFLICLTFFLTIFGTFLTRSGVVNSIHSFAQSNIGTYFLWFMGLIVATSVGLIVWRWPLLRSKAQIESLASREATFVVNNWALVGATVSIAVATTFPILSKWVAKESVTIPPSYYNHWMVPVGLTIFFLMGLGPLFGWRKTSDKALISGFKGPVIAAAAVGLLHALFGARLGYPALVLSDSIVAGPVGVGIQKLGSTTPVVTTSLAAFNLAVIAQEFWRGTSAIHRNGERDWLSSLFHLVAKAQRRYGGYIVHAGITLMFIGFVGQAWAVKTEASLEPGESMTVGQYTLQYRQPRMEVDPSKRMVFADLTVLDAKGRVRGSLSPAKFIYASRPEQPTTEVALLSSLREDLYVVIGSMVPQTGRASFQVHINPFVPWIWIGVVVLVIGASICLWPKVALGRARVWGYARLVTTVLGGVMLALILSALPARAFALSGSKAAQRAPQLPASQSLASDPAQTLSSPPHKP